MSNFEYNAPTALAGAYDSCANEVPLTWVAPTLNNLALFNIAGNYEWTPMQGFTSFVATVIGAGEGGQSGAVRQSAAFSGNGGNGGASGGYSKATFTLADLPGLVSILVGAGGAGGPRQTGVAPIGPGNGTAGGQSSFGANTPLVATGGTTTSVYGDTGGTGTTQNGNIGGQGGVTNTTAPVAGGASTLAPGGGGGGGVNASNNGPGTAAPGGIGATGDTSPSAGGLGGVGGNPGLTGGNGAVTATNFVGGGGGGGGAGGIAGDPSDVTGGPGGNGRQGGGGGGGGSNVNPDGTPTIFSGAGGIGGDGVIQITALDPILPLTGYRILRNGINIGEVGLTTAFTDTDPQNGVDVYTVVALSGETVISPPSNSDTIDLNITLQGQAAGNAGSDVLLTWSVNNCADTEFEIFQEGITGPIATLPQNAIDGFVVMHLNPDTAYCFHIVGDVNGPSNGVTVTTGCRAAEAFNCDCSLEPIYDTLAEMRYRMMVRLGYPNQAANPPPGMSALADAFVSDAQKLIWKQLSRAGINVERFFRWVMVPGQRYYGISANADRCTAKLDPYKVTWAGFEDLNRAWYRLTEGVPPEYYTRANINFGWPTHYEIRSCIEIFPAPQAPYTLWIKGDFGLMPLAADDDTCTIDSDAVFLLALGNAKSHYGQKDASSVLAQADTYIRGLVAGMHGTRRYVPRTRIQNPATPPRFLPLGDAQA